jgi:hypothetical protein
MAEDAGTPQPESRDPSPAPDLNKAAKPRWRRARIGALLSGALSVWWAAFELFGSSSPAAEAQSIPTVHHCFRLRDLGFVFRGRFA